MAFKIRIKPWKDISIAKKLYAVVGIMAVLIAGELLTLRFAMNTLSAVRAFVGGESLWSKAQKNAVFSLQRYAVTHDENDYHEFLNYLSIPDGDRLARTELEKTDPDFEIVRKGFIQGHIHPDDIEPITELLRRFYWISYMDRAIKVWREGDRLLLELKKAGLEYYELLKSNSKDKVRVAKAFDQIRTLNDKLTTVEEDFSAALGEGSRWLEHMIIFLLFIAVLTVETIGISLAFLTSRSISSGLAEVTTAANEIGQGNFTKVIPVRSRDEIGMLAEATNKMGRLLQASYRELESRVEQRTAELALMASENAKLYEQTKTALQTRDEFLSIASHELRTPLTALYMQLELLMRNASAAADPAKRTRTVELAESSLRQARRISLLVEKLMDLTKIRLGKLEVRREHCDVTAIVKDVVSQLSNDAARSGSTIAVHGSQTIVGECDSTRVAQIATNLISNAIKYGNGKAINVSVSAKARDVIIAVQDNGEGISSEQQARIFERFERANQDSGIAGLGLGLYITQQIVEAHHGTISVQSELGKGSLFTVKIPV